MTKPRIFRRSLFGLALNFVLLGGYPNASAESADDPALSSASDRCLAASEGLSLGAPLPQTKQQFQSGAPVTIVALGSSSTSGFGAWGDAQTFPQVMKRKLSELRPSTRIEVINSGRIMENIGGSLERIGSEVLPHRPNLVIWQLGTNDVVWRGIAGNARESIVTGLRWMKDAGADIVLMDLQYAPLVRIWPRHEDMQRMILEAARAEQAGHFPRFDLMKRAMDAGAQGLVSWDGLHNSAEGYDCIGRALARMIDEAAR
jgi:lysophospholipase L1-like esterase